MLPVIGDSEALRPFLTYELSLFLGLAIIALYGRSRFDRPVPALKSSPSSLFQSLAPSAMGPGSVRGSAHAVYFALLALVYLVLCIFGTSVLFTLFGLPIPPAPVTAQLSETVGLEHQAAGWAGARTVASSAATAYGEMAPLSIALLLVGLGPALPWLGPLEDRLRRLALGVAGLPDRVLGMAASLGPQRLLRDGDAAQVLSAEDRDILDTMSVGVMDGDAFRDDLAKALAFRAWFTRGGMRFPYRSADPELVDRENDVAGRTSQLLYELRNLPQAGAPGSGEGAARERRLADVSGRLALLADDICLLLALHAAHGLRLPGMEPGRAAAPSPAARALGDFLNAAAATGQDAAFRAGIWLRLTLVAVGVAFLAGLFMRSPDLGLDAPAHGPNWRTGAFTALSALFNIGPAVLVGLSIDRAAEAGAASRGSETGTPALFGSVACFFGATAASLLSLITLNVLLTIAAEGLPTVLNLKMPILQAALETEWPIALAGGVLALHVTVVIDAWRSGALDGRTRLADAMAGPGGRLALQCGVLFGGLIALSRHRELADSALRVGGELPGLQELLARPDVDLAVYAVIGFAIGLLTILFVASTLPAEYGRRDRKDDDATAVPPRAAAAVLGVALVAVLCLGGAAAQAEPRECEMPQQTDEFIRIGVRKDAPPFAYYDDAHRAYKGFLHDLCVKAVENAGYASCVKGVTTAERQALFTAASVGGQTEIDLLCDPTTLTVARLRSLNDGVTNGDRTATRWRFSPIVFLGSSGFVENGAAEAQSFNDVSKEETTSCRKGKVALMNYAVRSPQSQLGDSYFLVYVNNTSSAEKIGARLDRIARSLHEDRWVCARPEPDYAEAAAAFCGRMAGARWIVGDTDILRSVFARHKAKHGEACRQTMATFVEREPYAFLLSDRLPEFPGAFVQELYELFSDKVPDHQPSSAMGYLTMQVGESTPLSPMLETLFEINAIPAGASTVPKDGDRPDGGQGTGAGGEEISQAPGGAGQAAR